MWRGKTQRLFCRKRMTQRGETMDFFPGCWVKIKDSFLGQEHVGFRKEEVGADERDRIIRLAFPPSFLHPS